MTALEATKAATAAPEPWRLSVEDYHALAERGLIPEKTELLYGQVFHKPAKSPTHSFFQVQLLDALRPTTPPGTHVRQISLLLAWIPSPNPTSRLFGVRCMIFGTNTRALLNWSLRCA